jgi:hypothetical protein
MRKWFLFYPQTVEVRTSFLKKMTGTDHARFFAGEGSSFFFVEESFFLVVLELERSFCASFADSNWRLPMFGN